MGNLFSILFLAGLSTFCWVMVVNRSARQKSNKPAYDFWKMSKEGREMHDAATLAAMLVLALFFSLMTIFVAVVSVISWFNG
jgi:hypothetical protein